ncbi:hypothetical protein SAMN04490243_0044 [Robiginitalea myxolifaciens]|uniref:Cytochrome c domain-containing protein n=1 Tax=Robiginitalea myxolifaciens TaxID=400055 RepID=A0A1I6FN26_9FLAO|nr:hypothetical protein [Robiginitalea myxolifaciens]SFR31217.1 hypothetical protein SAMN04490243_0044 [Robiginitalea myxolifaciens]
MKFPSNSGGLLVLCLCLTLLVFQGCSSESDNGDLIETGGTNNPPSSDGGSGGSGNDNPEPLSFSADIQPIFNSNCVTCHDDPPTRSAPMPLVTLEEVREAVENRNLLGRINSVTRPMPTEGRMPSATRARIESWINQGMPE